ncbi:MAG: hypothetical protein QOG17_868 [Gammaproteobacteria bacterium]|jgi:hypothetical protein|nr:hypothetical protein [Bradyrhizobium sp.]MEA3133022.1 hypothetical protein [Gammaproteobacteria bacterium]
MIPPFPQRPQQPAPHMIITLSALSIRRAISVISLSLALNSPRGCACRLLRDHVLRKRQMCYAGPGIGGGDGLMDNRRRLCRGREGLGIERDVAKKQVGRGSLDEIGALHPARHFAGKRQHRGMVATSPYSSHRSCAARRRAVICKLSSRNSASMSSGVT